MGHDFVLCYLCYKAFTAGDIRVIVEALSMYKPIQIEELKGAIDADEDQSEPIMRVMPV
jgi:hypothetical protein